MTLHDEWDFDGVNETSLCDQTIEGRPRNLLIHFDRDGFAYAFPAPTTDYRSSRNAIGRPLGHQKSIWTRARRCMALDEVISGMRRNMTHRSKLITIATTLAAAMAIAGAER